MKYTCTESRPEPTEQTTVWRDGEVWRQDQFGRYRRMPDVGSRADYPAVGEHGTQRQQHGRKK